MKHIDQYQSCQPATGGARFLPRLFTHTCVTVLLLVAAITASQADVWPSEEPPSDSTEPVLTLEFADGESRNLSLGAVEALGLHDTEIEHFEGLHGRFTGIWLKDLLQEKGLEQAPQLRLIAQDGYTIFISADDRASADYLIATRFEGEPLAADQLGPLLMLIPEQAEAMAAGTAPRTHWIWAITTLQEFAL